MKKALRNILAAGIISAMATVGIQATPKTVGYDFSKITNLFKKPDFKKLFETVKTKVKEAKKNINNKLSKDNLKTVVAKHQKAVKAAFITLLTIIVTTPAFIYAAKKNPAMLKNIAAMLKNVPGHLKDAGLRTLAFLSLIASKAKNSKVTTSIANKAGQFKNYASKKAGFLKEKAGNVYNASKTKLNNAKDATVNFVKSKSSQSYNAAANNVKKAKNVTVNFVTSNSSNLYNSAKAKLSNVKNRIWGFFKKAPAAIQNVPA